MNKPPLKHPTLVAHRGASADYPENTITAYAAAIKAGAKFVELDVQVTADHVPVVHHDVDLKRITGVAGDITKITSADFLKLTAPYTEKFGDRFANNPMATLSEFSHWLSKHPGVTAFVEIKRQSVEAFGVAETAQWVLDSIAPIKKQSVVISFHDGVIQASRRLDSSIPIGWVLREYNQTTERRAADLAPEYLFCSIKRIPKNRKVWAGPWQWALYNTDTVAEALDYFRCGFEMLETNRIIDLLASPEFADHD